MRYQVPQFIEVEDKIFGPLTLKQGIYLAGGAGISFVIYRLLPLPFFIKIVPVVIICVFAIALAFGKVHQRFPFIYIVEAALKYFFGAKLYIWKKVDKTPAHQSQEEAKQYASIMVPKISNSKLKDLSWSLDIKESIYSNQNQR